MLIPILVFICGFISSQAYAAEEETGSNFQKDLLNFNPEIRQFFYHQSPVILDAPLEGALADHIDLKWEEYQGKVKGCFKRLLKEKKIEDMPKQQEILRVSQETVGDLTKRWSEEWFLFELQGARVKATPGTEEDVTLQFDDFACHFYTKPALRFDSVARTCFVEKMKYTALQDRSGRALVSFPRSLDPKYQLAYVDNGMVISYWDLNVPDHKSEEFLTSKVSRSPLVSSRITYSLPLPIDAIFIGDWVLTNQGFRLWGQLDTSELPDLTLIKHIPKSLVQRLLQKGLQIQKDLFAPMAQNRKTIKSLWSWASRGATLPDTFEAMKQEDLEGRFLKAILGNSRISKNLGFFYDGDDSGITSWGELEKRCRDISFLVYAFQIGDIEAIESWDDVFSIGQKMGIDNKDLVQVINSMLS